jgi:osmotically-inducible protein OsmY
MRHVLFGVAVALSLLGCTRRETDVDRSGTARTTGAPTVSSDKSGAGAPMSDDDVTVRVRGAIMDGSRLSYAARNVIVVVSKGVVTLRGQVSDARASAAIEQRARRTPGVERVDNQLEVSRK